VTIEVVMARASDGSEMFEVVRFHSPSAGAHEPAPAANRPGLRHILFTVDDVRGVVDRVREAGWDTGAGPGPPLSMPPSRTAAACHRSTPASSAARDAACAPLVAGHVQA
jgi:hypothetical protein